jgi:hypothetical protein
MDRFSAMSALVAGGLGRQFLRRGPRMLLPTVIRKVAELESHLDAKLLVRGTRRLALTQAGETYLAACRRILDDLAEAERGARGLIEQQHVGGASLGTWSGARRGPTKPRRFVEYATTILNRLVTSATCACRRMGRRLCPSPSWSNTARRRPVGRRRGGAGWYLERDAPTPPTMSPAAPRIRHSD